MRAVARPLQRAINVETYARVALFGCLLASGLGAAAVCLVGLKYGLAPPAEDDPIELTHRRVFLSHFAHAFAVVAFAITAMLAGSVLLLDRGGAPVGGAQRQELHAIERRLDGVEAVVRQMTDSLDRTMRRFDTLERTESRR